MLHKNPILLKIVTVLQQRDQRMNHPCKLAIGICTYQRPEELQLCLDSIAKIKIPLGLDCCILIADNDSQGSAKSIVESFSKDVGFSVYYEIESQRGIAAARNNVLHQAKSLSVTELAFIDDDEYVTPDWLNNLWNYYTSSSADVVNGPAITVYPDDTPSWIIRGQFHQSPTFKTGQHREWAPTGNVLFNFLKLVCDWEICFDESFGLTGGSDADFFSRAHKKGASIIWTNNAIVYAPLEKSRFSLKYLLAHRFGCGNQKRLFLGKSLLHRIKIMCTGYYQISKGIFWILLGGVIGKHRVFFGLARFVEGAGLCLGTLGIFVKVEKYK